MIFPDIAGEIFYFSKIDSTQAEAKRKLDDAISVPFTIIADTQIAGVGRFERKWYSPNGGTYFTWATDYLDNPAVSLIIGIALANTLKKLIPGYDVSIKWPNDLIHHNDKIAGILVEKYDNSLLIGIGINTFDDKDNYKSIPAGEWTRDEIISTFFHTLSSPWKNSDFSIWESFFLYGFEPFVHDFMELTFPQGTEIDVIQGKQVTTGRFHRVGVNGEIMLNSDGEILRFLSGEVSIKLHT